MIASLDLALAVTGPSPVWRGERLDVDWAVSVLWRPRGDDAGRVLPGAP